MYSINLMVDNDKTEIAVLINNRDENSRSHTRFYPWSGSLKLAVLGEKKIDCNK